MLRSQAREVDVCRVSGGGGRLVEHRAERGPVRHEALVVAEEVAARERRLLEIGRAGDVRFLVRNGSKDAS